MKKYINSILKRFFFYKRNKLKKQFNRVLPVNELFTDRWEKASYLGFGEGTSVYDSCAVFGDVKVGKDTWIGPFTVLDGSGGLTIGSNCSIGAGTNIYTHDTLLWAVSGGKEKYRYAATSIGDNVFIAAHNIILGGVKVGNNAAILANSYVNKDVAPFAVVAGNPAKQIGEIVMNEEGTPELKMYKNNAADK